MEKINVYDFDGTIYDGDSSIDFYLFLLINNIKYIRNLPFQIFSALLYLLKIIDKKEFKQSYFRFLKDVKNLDAEIEKFWDINLKKIKPWYFNVRNNSDIVISASPQFLVEIACKKIGINNCIATIVDKKTGKFNSENCHGQEKVKRLREFKSEFKISNFYSDSYSDTPLAKLSDNSYFVKRNIIERWNYERKN